jgi:hypothetical protein
MVSSKVKAKERTVGSVDIFSKKKDKKVEKKEEEAPKEESALDKVRRFLET